MRSHSVRSSSLGVSSGLWQLVTGDATSSLPTATTPMPIPFKPLPPVEALREYFWYEPFSGFLLWNKRTVRSHKKINDFAGLAPDKDGYAYVKFLGKIYQLHRIVWAMQTGKDPGPFIVDHIDRDPTNNSWENLRLASGSQNNFNSVQKSGSSGYRNVQFDSREGLLKPWRVRLRHHGLKKCFGRYESPEEADSVARAARESLRGEFVNHETK